MTVSSIKRGWLTFASWCEDLKGTVADVDQLCHKILRSVKFMIHGGDTFDV